MENKNKARDSEDEDEAEVREESREAVWNTMIDGYASVGDVESAAQLFSEMPKRDLISWTIIITCYAQNKQYVEALAVFSEMKSQGISPDEVTLTSVISACAHIGARDLGKEIHLYLMRNGFDLDVYLGSALIDMYAKCGSLDRSLCGVLQIAGQKSLLLEFDD
ncbi:basic helix loop helix (bHLH) DNA-binding superfamily protein [Actinidia rufa]|uniref:Basic helix loop helix (BHLH) DNA-binding superfamily protein n=1 Tax=Actinidia rufa TaxID=165716 RepID=A0A7J0FT67_9ERIC|nr:basic helix loop helix (bHLH) DNA-binding superfamily protein [Actinidia rufa]